MAELSETPMASIVGGGRHSAFKRELQSVVGRTLFARRPPRKNGILHLGCGELYKEGYCNADFFPFNFVRRLVGRKPKPVDWGLDLRYPLKCPDGFFRGVFCEHTLEHIDVWHGMQLLSELHRVLEPGGRVRLSVPDLEHYVRYYNGELPNKGFRQWQIPAEAIWSLTQNWGHQSVYDFQLLAKLLERVGFTDITRAEYLKGCDEALILDHRSRAWESLYVEAVRP